MRLAFAFPGVGAPLTGREAAFLERNKHCPAAPVERASALAGEDLEAALASDEAMGELSEVNVQLLTCAFSCAVARAVEAAGHRPVAVAGYSMGLYAALECAGVVPLDDALDITWRAHQTMRRVCRGRGSLAVIVGLSEQDLAALLEREELAHVRLVNRNNDTAMVCAGPVAELRTLTELALEADAIKAALLPADLPYHHPELLAGAPEAFAPFLASLTWREPACPVISAVSAEAVETPADLRDLTAAHLTRPIALPPMLKTLAALEVDAVVECGPGLSLTQSARMVQGAPPFINLKTLERRLGV